MLTRHSTIGTICCQKGALFYNWPISVPFWQDRAAISFMNPLLLVYYKSERIASINWHIVTPIHIFVNVSGLDKKLLNKQLKIDNNQ